MIEKTSLPPADLRCEQALLGVLLDENRVYRAIASMVDANDFADTVHALIYEAITQRIQAGGMASAGTLEPEFAKSRVLDEVGGTDYLNQLVLAKGEPTECLEYTRHLRGLAEQRAASHG